MDLTISNLTKQYDNGVLALDDINLKIGKGMFGLLGPNGAGKSTLMRTIATLQTPDKGNIKINKINIFDHPIELRKILGYLPQEFGIYPRESADHLLNYMAILKGISFKRDRKKVIDYVLDVTNLTDARSKHVSSYSGGMRQRFGIAQLLLNNPKLIIVDEPTAGLDPAERNRFLNILREIGTKSTVIFSTHIVDDIKELCTDMAILNNGKVFLHVTPREAIKQIEGKIWVSNIEPHKLESVKTYFDVLSSSYNDDNTIRVRIYSPVRPNETFSLAPPNLEDVYFTTLNPLKDKV